MENSSTVSAKRKALTGTTLVALFAALTAAGTFIAIPLPFSPVPIVLQNLFALLSGLILGPFLGGCAVGLYLVAGALGAPVFAGATGGFVRFQGPTGGFLIGYLFSAIVAGLIAGRPRLERQDKWWRIILAAFAGMLIVYVPGIPWFKFVLDTTWTKAFALGMLPYLILDGIKAVAAILIAPRLRRLIAELR
jgi:biotin transport system substrate-specific component